MSVSRRPLLVGCLLVGVLPAPGSAAQEDPAGGVPEAPVRAAVEAAREGGVVIVCRHAVTGSFREQEPVDYGDPSTQRRLSTEGERQSRAMGRALRALNVEVAELVASPMQRARRTATLMFDRPVAVDSAWHTNGGSYEGPARDRRAAVLATPVPRGNRLIVSHIGTMRSVLPLEDRRVREGDCVVVRPRKGAFEYLGVVPWRAWLEAAGTEPGPDPGRRGRSWGWWGHAVLYPTSPRG